MNVVKSKSTARSALVWGTEVSPAHLCAHLETYVETKAAITTFAICNNKRPTPLSRELVDKIAEEIRISAYRTNIRDMLFAEKCWQAKCEADDHFTRPEKEDEIDACEPNDHTLAAWWHRHCIKHYSKMISTPHTCPDALEKRTTDDFMKCQEIFAADFGIRPIFIIRAGWDIRTWQNCGHPHEWDFEPLPSISAFLTLPVANGPPISVDNTSIKGLSPIELLAGVFDELKTVPEAVLRNFAKAMRALQLNRVHELARYEGYAPPRIYGELYCIECHTWYECDGKATLIEDPKLMALEFETMDVF